MESINEIINICNNTPYKLKEGNTYTRYIINKEFIIWDNIKIKYNLIRKKLYNLNLKNY